MQTDQLPPRVIRVPTVIICDGSKDARTMARDYSLDVTAILVLPAGREVVAFISDGAVTFRCTTELLVSNVLVGLGCFTGTSDVPAKYTDANAPRHLQYGFRKTVIGGGITIEPF